jgi:hypothetical protein
MKKRGCGFLSSVSALALLGILACAAPPETVTPAGSAVTCIRGVVRYADPASTAMVPYSSVAVTAWRQGGNQGLAEVKTDKEGKYCIEVPSEAGSADLRVLGLERIEGKNYVCEGSANNIPLAVMTGKCGSGNCLEVNISALCRERVQRRRGF